MKKMQILMENWNKFLDENKSINSVDVFYRICEQKQALRDTQKEQVLKEASGVSNHIPEGMGLDIGPEGVHGHIQAIGPWGALVAVSATAAWSALNIAALNASAATGVAFFISTSAVPLMIAGVFGWLYLKAKLNIPDWMKRVFDAFSKKQDPLEAAQDKIKETISNIIEHTDLTEEQAVVLMEIVNKSVHDDKDCQHITEKLLEAIEDNDSDTVQFLTDTLDDAVTNVYERLLGQLEAMAKKDPEETT